MAHLIDKDALVAEIERRKQKLLDNIISEQDKEWAIRTAHQFNRISEFLDTLEVKEVDLDKAYNDFLESRKKKGYMLFEVAKHFFELGLKAQRGLI